MGLDIYVGSLTRYFAGNWELVTQTAARELGTPITIVRKHDPEGAIREPDVLRPIILEWREHLSQALVENLTDPLEWDEGDESPYFTDKPTWDCYADLLLWAAYEEQPDWLRPIAHIAEWSEDPAYAASVAGGFISNYSHLYEVELWLPCPFSFTFETADVGGAKLRVGSSLALFQQLNELNSRTWRADAQVLEQWAFDGAEFGSPLEEGARFAFAIFHKMARESSERKLPMRLDW